MYSCLQNINLLLFGNTHLVSVLVFFPWSQQSCFPQIITEAILRGFLGKDMILNHEMSQTWSQASNVDSVYKV